LREKRNVLENNITTYAFDNNLSQSTIQISDGKLRFSNTKVPEPLTFKYLEKTLGEVIKNESQVKLIMDHLKQKRAIKKSFLDQQRRLEEINKTYDVIYTSNVLEHIEDDAKVLKQLHTKIKVAVLSTKQSLIKIVLV
jgi:hypothetical protein